MSDLILPQQPNVVALRTSHDFFVALEPAQDGMLLGNAEEDTAEPFTLLRLRNGKVALLASNGNYVTAVYRGRWPLLANARELGEAQQFDMQRLDDGRVCFRTAYRRNVTAMDDQPDWHWELRAETEQILAWEKFTLVPIDSNPAVPCQPIKQASLSPEERQSLERQLQSARENLRLIEERKSEFVLGTDVPLQLVKEERRLRERIAELEAKLGAGGQPPVSPVSMETPPPSPHPAIDLAAGIVAICAANGDIEGTGFVVAERLIITCAHVVEAAGGAPHGGGPGRSIGVRFHLNGARQTAQVVNEYWRGPDVDDIAVLRLTENLPGGVQPLGLGKSIGSEKHAFRSLGYPSVGDYVGIAASGVIESSAQKTDGRRMLQLTSTQLAQGHSGAPVWDEVQGGVVGMVSEVYHAGRDNKNRDTAFATPAEVLGQVCPEVNAQGAGPRRSLENPFYITGRINDPALFFGRERLVREIRDELSKRNSVSLVGTSQIGKSSLLYFLYATRAAWLPATAVEYLDLQRVLDEADFCETLLKKLGAEGHTLRQVKQTLETREVILLLDEVERIAEPDFSTRLHDLLRSLAQEPSFAMCLVTQRPLEEVFPPRLAGGVSPFHNVFTRKTLGPFTEAECRRFLTNRLAVTNITFTAREIERLLRDSQCHPAELQRLAKALFDEKIE